MKVNVINDSVNELPKYAKAGDSGMDLRANFSNGIENCIMHNCDWDEERKVLMMQRFNDFKGSGEQE